MSIENHTAKIQELEAKINQIKQRCESLVNEFVDVITTYLPEAIDDVVNRAVGHNPEIIKSLGAEKIREIKKEISLISTSARVEASDQLGRVDWVHRREIKEADLSTQNFFNLQDVTKRSLEDAIRLILGKVGALLIESGIETVSGQWQKADGSSSIVYSSKYQLPNHGMSPSLARFSELFEMYKTLLTELFRTLIELKSTQSQKKASEAKDTWNQA
jgi:hypothetical protein